MAAEWQPRQLGDLIEIKHGFAFKGEYFRDDPPGDILLTPGNFAIGGGFKADKIKYYEGPVDDEFVLTLGELIVTMTDLSKNADTLGYPVIVPKPNGPRFLHNQRLGKIEIYREDLLDKEFLYYLLCSREYRHEVVAGATGTTVKHTSPSRIKAFTALFPSLSEQKVIAHILGTLDDKIELNGWTNETLESMARAIFKSWFVDFDPVRAKMDGRKPAGMDDATAALFPDGFEDSEIGKIPAGWRAGKLGDVVSFRNGKAIKSERYNAIGQYPVFGSNGEIARTDDVLNEVSVIVIGRVGAYCGSVHRVDGASWVTDNAILATPAPGSNLEYLYQLLLVADLGRTAIGSAQPLITQAGLKILSTTIPPLSILEEFERIIAPFYESVSTNTRQTTELAAIRDTLLPKLLSGEI